MKRPTVAIVGAGRLGTALAVRLAEIGYSVPEIVVRQSSRPVASATKLARAVGARVVLLASARATCDVTWFCVPDTEVAEAATRLGMLSWENKIAFHSSGVLTSDALTALRRKGAHVASVHPLMTFVRSSIPRLEGVPFSIEGDPEAVRIARSIVRGLGGKAIALRTTDKAAYHAFATIICPLLVSLLASAEAVAGVAGIPGPEARRRMMPIIRQTLDNYLKLGPAESFSGPLVRGDAETVRLHLRTLAKTPAARQAYVALAKAALEFLPSRNTKKLQTLLKTC